MNTYLYTSTKDTAIWRPGLQRFQKYIFIQWRWFVFFFFTSRLKQPTGFKSEKGVRCSETNSNEKDEPCKRGDWLCTESTKSSCLCLIEKVFLFFLVTTVKAHLGFFLTIIIIIIQFIFFLQSSSRQQWIVLNLTKSKRIICWIAKIPKQFCTEKKCFCFSSFA